MHPCIQIIQFYIFKLANFSENMQLVHIDPQAIFYFKAILSLLNRTK